MKRPATSWNFSPPAGRRIPPTDDPELRVNLGNVLLAQGQLTEALAIYQAVLDGGFDHHLVHYNMGTALRRQGRLIQALATFDIALERAPDFAPAHNNRGNTLRDIGHYAEAAGAYLEALRLRPCDTGTMVNLSSVLVLLHAENADVAAALARLWLSTRPGDAMAAHVAKAIAGGPVPERADNDYVRCLFDGFAAEFDQRLTALDYQAPALIAAALVGRPSAAELMVLDAGCGTGLAASTLRPYARRLVGVDLSPAMLDRARVLGLYDDLVISELTDFLLNHQNTFDLIVATDVLIYFGILDRVLAAAATALRPGGGLIFTVESEFQSEVAPITLQPNGRYRHDLEMVRATLAGAGFDKVTVTRETIRHEDDQAVAALLFKAQT